jgi:NAD(P)-dependent dehydrogenase (short-subunit alcohol dehydrogenase family)
MTKSAHMNIDTTIGKALVIGASSAIAIELIKQLLIEENIDEVIAVSRTIDHSLKENNQSNLQWLQSDYTETSIKNIIEQLAATKGQLTRIFICNGILHGQGVFPEKRLEDFDAEHFQEVMRINTLIPGLWIKHLKVLVKGKQDCVITAFSARVGSIDDNNRGGWYTYRTSKAALNMMLKTASIEYRRIARQSRFLAFHPGTTDTALSKPFQKSVPEGKLFTPEFVAERLISIVNRLELEPTIQYLDWDAKPISW